MFCHNTRAGSRTSTPKLTILWQCFGGEAFCSYAIKGKPVPNCGDIIWKEQKSVSQAGSLLFSLLSTRHSFKWHRYTLTSTTKLTSYNITHSQTNNPCSVHHICLHLTSCMRLQWRVWAAHNKCSNEACTERNWHVTCFANQQWSPSPFTEFLFFTNINKSQYG